MESSDSGSIIIVEDVGTVSVSIICRDVEAVVAVAGIIGVHGQGAFVSMSPVGGLLPNK